MQKEIEPLLSYREYLEDNIKAMGKGMIDEPRILEGSLANSMEWRYEFPEVLDENGAFKGFDLIIGNLPYFSLTGAHPYKRMMSSGDIYQLFIEKALDWIHNRGLVSYVVSNSWMRAHYGQKTRTWLLDHTHITEIINLGVDWFDTATVETNIITYKKQNDQPCQKKIVAWVVGKEDKKKGDRLQDSKKNSAYIYINADKEVWSILTEDEFNLIHKIGDTGTPLKDWDIDMYRGVTSGRNEAFILDEVAFDRISQNNHELDIVQPILSGEDLEKYNTPFVKRWFISTFPSKKIDITQYPNTQSHLTQYRTWLEQSGEEGARKKTSHQ